MPHWVTPLLVSAAWGTSACCPSCRSHRPPGTPSSKGRGRSQPATSSSRPCLSNGRLGLLGNACQDACKAGPGLQQETQQGMATVGTGSRVQEGSATAGCSPTLPIDPSRAGGGQFLEGEPQTRRSNRQP